MGDSGPPPLENGHLLLKYGMRIANLWAKNSGFLARMVSSTPPPALSCRCLIQINVLQG